MKRLASLISLIMLVASVAWADEERIAEVISAQLTALSNSDFQAAYEYASPAVKGQIRTPANFGVMVQSFFPMMLNVDDVTYSDQRMFSGLVLQRVRITDAGGRRYWFAYEMIKVGAAWKINGVTRIEPPGMLT